MSFTDCRQRMRLQCHFLNNSGFFLKLFHTNTWLIQYTDTFLCGWKELLIINHAYWIPMCKFVNQIYFTYSDMLYTWALTILITQYLNVCKYNYNVFILWAHSYKFHHENKSLFAIFYWNFVYIHTYFPKNMLA